ncbi:MAG: phycobilisome rod-core linker polypeptide [Cyanobacteria bacterium J06635_1]
MINNSLFRPSVIKANRQKFNPEGFDLAAVLKAREVAANTPPPAPPPLETTPSDSYLNAFSDFQPIELIEGISESESTLVIEAAYKQVFGNAHLMESERLSNAESQLRSGQITVMEFVRRLAKSERYRVLFFDRCPNLRTIELNFKHLLGRAPESHAEISQHIQILAEGGFDAEMDSYLDSDEYFQNFGTNIVPYYRGYKTQTGKRVAGFTHAFQLFRGASSSDKSIAGHTSPQLQAALISDKIVGIQPLSTLPAPPLKMSLFKPIPVKEITFKDLDCRPRYKSQEYLSKPVSSAPWLKQYKAREAASTFPAARESQPIKLLDGAAAEELEILIRAAYKQVFGNVHLMESQRLLMAESKLKDGQLTVRDFIRELAKSDAYRTLFFESCSNVRAIELNFKHLLGRAPDSQQEVAEHVAILASEGFEAEINAYLDSPEYEQNFGEDTVPYYVSYETQTGKNVAGYNRIFQVIKGACSSDRSIATNIAASGRAQLQKSLLQTMQLKQRKTVFNPKGFNLAKALGVGIYREESRPPSISGPYVNAFADHQPIELAAGDAAEQQTLVIEAAYKQVFGNAHLMESERLPKVESQLRSGQITVMEFVRRLAKSERYRVLFFDNCSNLRAIELNFKHLLGRAPESHAEISQHIQILAEGGFDAEIDSYLDSDEYFQNFGTNIVPYYRGYKTQTGKNVAGFTHSFQLLRGASSSDKSKAKNAYAELDQTLLSNHYTQIETLSKDSTGHDDITDQTLAQSTQDQPITYDQPSFEMNNGFPANQRAVIWQNQYKALANVDPIAWTPGSSDQDAELVIKAIYKQVLGNAHIMESERLTVAESQLKDGRISVREFVRWLAKSELYKSRFIDKSPRYRTHELNFKHLLGRAPDSYQETIHHSSILDSQGYEADIDTYIDSNEYQEVFGENIVPYYRGYKTQTGKRLLGYTNMFEMLPSVSTSDQATGGVSRSRLQKQLMHNTPNGNQPVTDVRELLRKVLNL